jgi:hypothetical protein
LIAFTVLPLSKFGYHPGGMMMPGRKYQAGTGLKYRFSINGQEKESDLNENITTALFWEYDSRIGRRWNVDPVLNVSISPYVCFDNNPIWFTDVLGNQAKGPGPKTPNFKIGNIPVFTGDFEFPKIHDIDLKYSKSDRGKIHSKTFKLPFGTVTLIAVTVEKDKVKQQKNRDANKAANPTQVGNRANNTAGHEVPYASTQQGGALAMREVTDATQNSNHGNALNSFYKEFNLNSGDLFFIALFEPTPQQPVAIPKTSPSFDPKFPPLFFPLVPAPSAPPSFRPVPIPIPSTLPTILPPLFNERILKIIIGIEDKSQIEA